MVPIYGESSFQKITAQELYGIIGSGRPLQNYEISEEIFINASTHESINFFKCKFSKLIILTQLRSLTISHCDFEEIAIKKDIQNINISNINSDKAVIRASKISVEDIHLNSCKLDKIIFGQTGDVVFDKLYCFELNINSLALFGTIKKVFLNKGNQIEGLTLNGDFKDIEIVNKGLLDEKLALNKIEDLYYINRSEKNRLQIQNSSITNLYSIGQHIDAYIELTEVICKKATFIDDFGQNGRVKIKTCNELSTISFISTNIANFEIFNSNLSKTIFISNQSIIEKIRWQSVEWPEDLELYRNSEIDKEINDSFCRETLRILKLNAQTQQDTINYIKFHSLELQAYRLQIKTKKWYDGDRILLFLNTISNNHGLSWERGILFSLGIGALFFIPNLFLLNSPYWEFRWSNWSDFWRVTGTTIKLFSQSLYAAHSFDYLNDYNPKGIVFLFDLVGRIFLTYGYYQTIVAFRKFGKR